MLDIIVSLKGIEDENFVNYKKASMFLATTQCSFKCDRESGKYVCINSPLVKQPTIYVKVSELIERYKNNPITEAIVIGGLEPFDTYSDLLYIVRLFRKAGINDDIVIYTGYNEDEIEDKVIPLAENFDNLIIKFGRFIPDVEGRYDDVLGVTLASYNQYAKKIS